MISKQELDKFLSKLISDEEKNLLNKMSFFIEKEMKNLRYYCELYK